jgi:hypothetical protein
MCDYSLHAVQSRPARTGPCDESFIRGVAAALVGSVAAVAVGKLRSGAVFMSIFPRHFFGHAPEARAVRQRAGDGSLQRLSIVKRILCAIATGGGATAGP